MKTLKRRYTIQNMGTQIRLVPEYVKGYELPKNFERVMIEKGQSAFGVEYEALIKRRWIDV